LGRAAEVKSATAGIGDTSELHKNPLALQTEEHGKNMQGGFLWLGCGLLVPLLFHLFISSLLENFVNIRQKMHLP
jgi:hypothetical protein